MLEGKEGGGGMSTSYLHFSPREKEQVWGKVPSIMGDALGAGVPRAGAAAGASARWARGALGGGGGWMAGGGGARVHLQGCSDRAVRNLALKGH